MLTRRSMDGAGPPASADPRPTLPQRLARRRRVHEVAGRGLVPAHESEVVVQATDPVCEAEHVLGTCEVGRHVRTCTPGPEHPVLELRAQREHPERVRAPCAARIWMHANAIAVRSRARASELLRVREGAHPTDGGNLNSASSRPPPLLMCVRSTSRAVRNHRRRHPPERTSIGRSGSGSLAAAAFSPRTAADLAHGHQLAGPTPRPSPRPGSVGVEEAPIVAAPVLDVRRDASSPSSPHIAVYERRLSRTSPTRAP